MRMENRRRDLVSSKSLVELRHMMRAFGAMAAKRVGERECIPSDLVLIAISSKYERRQWLRRSTD
jgi:hypothetical protein